MTGALSRIDIRGRGGVTLAREVGGGPAHLPRPRDRGLPESVHRSPDRAARRCSRTWSPSIEQHVDWIADCIALPARAAGSRASRRRPRPRTPGSRTSTRSRTPRSTRRCNSWYLGANVPGKPRVFMPYLGFPPYVREVQRGRGEGLRGLRARLSARWLRTDAARSRLLRLRVHALLRGAPRVRRAGAEPRGAGHRARVVSARPRGAARLAPPGRGRRASHRECRARRRGVRRRGAAAARLARLARRAGRGARARARPARGRVPRARVGRGVRGAPRRSTARAKSRASRAISASRSSRATWSARAIRSSRIAREASEQGVTGLPTVMLGAFPFPGVQSRETTLLVFERWARKNRTPELLG